MAYGLPRKNTVKTILRGGCFKVELLKIHTKISNSIETFEKKIKRLSQSHSEEPWDLALLTKTWYMNLANIKLPFLEEITFGSPFYLQKNKTTKSALLPSAESIKLEREYEMKRLKNLKCQKILAEEVQFSLRERQVGLRRPLPPK